MSSLRGYWAILLTFVAAVAAVAVGIFAYTGMREPVIPSVNHAARSLESRGPSDQTNKHAQGDSMARQIAPSARQQSPPSPP